MRARSSGVTTPLAFALFSKFWTRIWPCCSLWYSLKVSGRNPAAGAKAHLTTLLFFFSILVMVSTPLFWVAEKLT